LVAFFPKISGEHPSEWPAPIVGISKNRDSLFLLALGWESSPADADGKDIEDDESYVFVIPGISLFAGHAQAFYIRKLSGEDAVPVPFGPFVDLEDFYCDKEFDEETGFRMRDVLTRAGNQALADGLRCCVECGYQHYAKESCRNTECENHCKEPKA
jgi:hypothetical protein